MNTAEFLAAALIILGGCKPVFFFDTYTYGYAYRHLEKAEKYVRDKKYPQAIEEYEKHIQERLTDENRPDWENPNFYYLFIGDLYLRQGKVKKCLESYKTAWKNGVGVQLISDRIRMTASWYESQGELQKAIDLLAKYRELDPLLFDDVMDRLAREIVRREDAALHNEGTEKAKQGKR